MTPLPEGWTENENHDLVSKDGLVIPMEKRTQPEIFSRIVGYLRPIKQWNKGKQSEWKDRVNFIAPKIEGAEVKDGGDA
jgi:ribonucleoside-triphosphate reductase